MANTGRNSSASPASAPWALAAAHLGRAYPFFLDRAGGVSFAGSAPRALLVIDAHGRSRCWQDGAERTLERDPVAAIEEFVRDAEVASPFLGDTGDPVVVPRTVGYFAYELGFFLENIGAPLPPTAGAPLAVLATYDEVDAWAPGWPAPRRLRLARPAAAGARPLELVDEAGRDWTSTSRGDYERGFRRIAQAIRDGEIYQANLARRIVLPLAQAPWAAYRRLREVQPVPHGACFDLGSLHLLSNSPERFLRIYGDTIETEPIKGTRARAESPAADRARVADLLDDAKERAEHIMIVDLERNDLGRVCDPASVHVAELARVVSLSTVHHLVSLVRGRLRDGVGLGDVLRAVFPGGSITGAPKIRAMQIINEVETHGRGVYTGAIGCFNGGRACDLNIAIRTAVVRDGAAHYWTGGGIVADSTLVGEWEETQTKARAFLRALEAASPAAA